VPQALSKATLNSQDDLMDEERLEEIRPEKTQTTVENKTEEAKTIVEPEVKQEIVKKDELEDL